MSKKIGFLVSATRKIWKNYIDDAFEDELFKHKGWTNCTGTGPKDVCIDYEPQKDANGNAIDGAAGDPGLIQQTAALFADPANNFDVIVTAGEVAVDVCKTATNANKPPKPIIVVASAGDLSKFAGTNVTGFTNGQVNTDISDERIKRMNNKWNPIFVMVAGNDDVPPVKKAMDYVLGKLGNKGYRVSLKNDTDVTNLQNTLAPHKKPNGVNVLYVCSDPFLRTNGNAIVDAAHAEGMKTMHEFAEWHDKHKGDLCFGPDFQKLFRKAAGYVDLILADPKLATPPIVEAKVEDCVQSPP